MPKNPRNVSWYFEWACWLLILLCCSSILYSQAGGEGPSIDLSTYRAELDRLAQAAARLGEHPEEGQAVRDSLPSKWVISDEKVGYEVSTARLADDLERWQKDPQGTVHLESFKRRIRQLQVEADAFAAAASPASGARQK